MAARRECGWPAGRRGRAGRIDGRAANLISISTARARACCVALDTSRLPNQHNYS